jgi:hypothetical protein
MLRSRSGLFPLLLFICCNFATAQTGSSWDVKKRKLPDSVLNHRTLIMRGRFDANSVLLQLFPGRVYNKVYEGSKPDRFISWVCPSCKPKQIEDANGASADSVLFPDPTGMATRLLNVFSFSDSTGQQYKLISFNHSSYDPDGTQTGRFQGGILGMAKFARIDSGWRLECFAPAIGSYGSFSQAPVPRPVLIGEHQYAWLIPHVNGGPGGPFYHDTYLIAEVGGVFREILSAGESGRDGYLDDKGDSLCTWVGTVSVPPSDNHIFRDIVIASKGRYFAQDTAGLLAELERRLKNRRKGNFRITRTFIYSEEKGYHERLPARVWMN